jgi:putative peptidoglycan lipid II flippase
MLGLTMTFSTEVFSKFFGSYLPVGGISWIEYAMRIMLMMVAFFGQAAGVASFPFMARLAAENRIGEMNRLLNDTLRYLALVMPVSVLLMVLRHEVVAVLYQRGHFLPADTLMTARLLPFLLVGSVAFAVQTVVNRGFYATQNTLFPALYGTAAVLASIPVYILGLRTMGLAGVALAISVSAMIQVLALYVMWNRRFPAPERFQVYRFYLKVAVMSLPLGMVLEVIRRGVVRVFHPAGLAGDLATVACLGGCFLGLLLAVARLWKIDEVFHILGRIRSRLPGWGGG